MSLLSAKPNEKHSSALAGPRPNLTLGSDIGRAEFDLILLQIEAKRGFQVIHWSQQVLFYFIFFTRCVDFV